MSHVKPGQTKRAYDIGNGMDQIVSIREIVFRQYQKPLLILNELQL